MTNEALSVAPVRILFTNENARLLYGESGLQPATPQAVGIDLRACITLHIPVAPSERKSIPVGIALEPRRAGIAGFVYSRSGLGAVKGLVVAQGVGIIDPDYRGEVSVFLLNTSQEVYIVQPGERIAQIVFQPYFRPVFEEVAALNSTERGTGGFGHTGQ